MSTARRRDLFATALLSSVITALVLGGGVAVALNVPNNSVTSPKIVNNTIKSQDIRNATVLDADLNRETRTFWALVEFQGGAPSLAAGEGVFAVQDRNQGSSNVIWTANITNCAVQATAQSLGDDIAASRLIVTAEPYAAANGRDGLFIQTFNDAGAPTDPQNGAGYALTVNC